LAHDKNQFTLSVIVAAVAAHFKNIHGVSWDAASICTIDEASYNDGKRNKSALA
jgi:hypothetical protein